MMWHQMIHHCPAHTPPPHCKWGAALADHRGMLEILCLLMAAAVFLQFILFFLFASIQEVKSAFSMTHRALCEPGRFSCSEISRRRKSESFAVQQVYGRVDIGWEGTVVGAEPGSYSESSGFF